MVYISLLMNRKQIFQLFSEKSIGQILLEHSGVLQERLNKILAHQTRVIAYCLYKEAGTRETKEASDRKVSALTTAGFWQEESFAKIEDALPKEERKKFKAKLAEAAKLAEEQKPDSIPKDADIFPQLLVNEGLLSKNILNMLLVTRASFRVLNLSRNQPNVMTSFRENILGPFRHFRFNRRGIHHNSPILEIGRNEFKGLTDLMHRQSQ